MTTQNNIELSVGFSNIKDLTLDDLHKFYEEFRYPPEDSVGAHNNDIRFLKQLSWAFKKDNDCIKTIEDKEARLIEMMRDINHRGLAEKDLTQAAMVLNCSFSDLPLLLNDVSSCLAKCFMTWRLKIKK